MADAFVELQAHNSAADSAHAEWLALLLDREVATRNTKRFYSRLPAPGYVTARRRSRTSTERRAGSTRHCSSSLLAAGPSIVDHRDLLVTGPCGVEKTWLSCALAHKGCRDGYTVHYARLPRLFADLELARGDGRMFRALIKADLLVLDDPSMRKIQAGKAETALPDADLTDQPHAGRGRPTLTSETNPTAFSRIRAALVAIDRNRIDGRDPSECAHAGYLLIDRRPGRGLPSDSL